MDATTMPGYVDGFPLTLGLRELGGWRSGDGRTVKHGLLYRGSAFVDLDPSLHQRIDDLGLVYILDLRAQGEVEGKQDYVPQGTRYERIGGMYTPDGIEVDFSPTGIARIIDFIQSDADHFLSNLYAGMMFDNPAVHALVEQFVAGRAPLYFHCTAGKDRTGVCAAVLLMLLGVPDEQIADEYLLTNEYRASIINMRPEELPEGISDMDRKNWATINGVRRELLDATFAAVDARFATREDYFAKEFGIDANDLTNLRNRYLEG